MSERQSPFVPDDSQRRQLAHQIYGAMDDNFNPYTPLLYTSPRPGPARRDLTAVTVFLFAVLVLAILNFIITIEAISYSYQVAFAVRHLLWPLRHADRLKTDP